MPPPSGTTRCLLPKRDTPSATLPTRADYNRQPSPTPTVYQQPIGSSPARSQTLHNQRLSQHQHRVPAHLHLHLPLNLVGAHRRHIPIALASLVSPSIHRHPDNLATAGGKFAFYIDFCYNVLRERPFILRQNSLLSSNNKRFKKRNMSL